MNGLYTMLLFLFILGAGSQLVNEIGVFGVSVPDAGISASNGVTVTNLHEGALKASSEYGAWEILSAFMKVIGGGILAMFTIIPLMVQWGSAMGAQPVIMVAIGAFVQVPITIVTLFGLWEFWTGRGVA